MCRHNLFLRPLSTHTTVQAFACCCKNYACTLGSSPPGCQGHESRSAHPICACDTLSLQINGRTTAQLSTCQLAAGSCEPRRRSCLALGHMREHTHLRRATIRPFPRTDGGRVVSHAMRCAHVYADEFMHPDPNHPRLATQIGAAGHPALPHSPSCPCPCP